MSVTKNLLPTFNDRTHSRELPKMPHSSDCVIFIHIGKTAGTTLSVILIKQYAEQTIFAVDGSKGITADTLRALPDEEKSRINLLRGHILFGLHKHLPQPSTYITMLRNPANRIISLYYHILREKTHYLHQAVTGQQMTLEDFVASGVAAEIDNFQMRALAGYESVQTPVGKCDRTLLNQAKENVEKHFSVVGITERFDESLHLMTQRLGWKTLTPHTKIMNVATNKSKKNKEFSNSTLRLIKEKNSLDYELYDWACRSFDEQVKQSLQDQAE